jgi:uncharacterized protein (TIGR02118 family)
MSGGSGSGQVRNLTVLTRRADLTPAEFNRHWREVHAPMVAELPGVLRYSQHHVLDSATRAGYPTQDYEIDGMVDFRFANEEAMTSAFDSDLGRALMDDAKHFIARMCVYTVEEHVVVDRTVEG